MIENRERTEEMEEETVLELMDDAGQVHRCKLIDTIPFNSKMYAIFQDIERMDEQRGMITAFEVVEEENGEGKLSIIEEQEVMDAVFDLFCRSRQVEEQVQEQVQAVQEQQQEQSVPEEEDIIELSEENGSRFKAKKILSFTLKNREYIALQHVNEQKEDVADISIYELVEEGQGQRLVPLQKDARGFAVWSTFRRLLEKGESEQ